MDVREEKREGRAVRMQLAVLGASCLILLGVGGYQYHRFFDGRLHVVFCDIGQGDAIFIRTPRGEDILVDGGPDDSVLDCLGQHMPFWDRRIDMVFATHGDADHITGLIDVVKRYEVEWFGSEGLPSDSLFFKELQKSIERKKIHAQFLDDTNVIHVGDGVDIDIVWPIDTHDSSSVKTASPDRNRHSLVHLVRFGSFEILLTGDIEADILNSILKRVGDVDILKLPHHGSASGIDAETFTIHKPTLAIVSSGEGNRYGHPSASVLKLVSEAGVKIARTDQEGDIEVVSDGRRVEVFKRLVE